MPAKYVIHTRTVSHRFEPITKSGIIAWEEGCLKCAVCVKKKCVYGVYEKRGLNARQMIDSIDNQCMNCMRCVQDCPKELIHKSSNPEYRAIGDEYWSPDIISRLWYQAETGKIPVSGAGYPGPFSGAGFDSMWTDMSEIVRPTRDGIHGREYISTAVDLGRTPEFLRFDPSGRLKEEAPGLISIPIPVILRVPGFGDISRATVRGWSMAARKLGTLLALPPAFMEPSLHDLAGSLVPILPEDFDSKMIPKGVPMVEIPWSDGISAAVQRIRSLNPSIRIVVRLPMGEGMEHQALTLVEVGVSIVHLRGNLRGRGEDGAETHIKEGIRSVHRALVDAGVRDGMSLLVSGGIAMAEHVAKSVICGTDAVFVDFPILIALECRMCRRCVQGLGCPVEIAGASSTWVARRVINLMGAWHNQLLEVMGAMGIRDARRLRGETGRAMFFEELDRASFGSLGRAEEGTELE